MKCINPEDREKVKLEPDQKDECESDKQEFCARQHVCLPKHANCTEPVKFDYFSVSSFANRSGRYTSL